MRLRWPNVAWFSDALDFPGPNDLRVFWFVHIKSSTCSKKSCDGAKESEEPIQYHRRRRILVFGNSGRRASNPRKWESLDPASEPMRSHLPSGEAETLITPSSTLAHTVDQSLTMMCW